MNILITGVAGFIGFSLANNLLKVNNKIKIYGLDLNLVLWKKGQNSLSSSTIQKILDGYRVYNVYMKYNFIKSIYYLICLSFNYLKK